MENAGYKMKLEMRIELPHLIVPSSTRKQQGDSSAQMAPGACIYEYILDTYNLL